MELQEQQKQRQLLAYPRADLPMPQNYWSTKIVVPNNRQRRQISRRIKRVQDYINNYFQTDSRQQG